MALDIIIVGAGVVGLSLALAICENSKQKKHITIIAEHLPDSLPYLKNYTSPWAGAHFRPFPLKNEAELREYPLTRLTWHRMKRFAKEESQSSVQLVQGIEYIEEPDEKYRSIGKGFSEGIENFVVLDKAELPEGFQFGVKYDTYALNAPHYIQFLQLKLRNDHRVKFVRKKLQRFRDATLFARSSSPIIINCTGLGLQWDGKYDPACYPIRGQTLLIRAPKGNSLSDKTITIQHKLGDWTFCINRPLHGGTIIGGTKQAHFTDKSVRAEDSLAILNRAEKYFPLLMVKDFLGLKRFDVIRTNVGFRPARKGGLRLALEKRGEVVVVHAYGAAGSGFELSYGIGLKIYEAIARNERISRL